MQPEVKPLSYNHRNFIFIFLTAIFLLSLPAFIFYGLGYRYNFFAESPAITVTGGLYIVAATDNSQIYLDEVESDKARIFRKASYIQGITPGLHRVHVQAPGLHTWVKELMVSPQIVTEAEAFNLPIIPQVRPVTEYLTNNGESLYRVVPDNIFAKASSSESYIISTSTSTSTLAVNPEFVILKELFNVKASTTAARLAFEEKQNKEKFKFATITKEIIEIQLSTTTVNREGISLYRSGEDIFAKAIGKDSQVPSYYCSSQFATDTDNGLDNRLQNFGRLDQFTTSTQYKNQFRLCRTDIKLDRKWQKVHDFDFAPDNVNLVLMQLDDGIYMTEIDDRAWQNVQLLYPGKDLMMVVYRNNLFVKEDDFIFEALTAIDN